MLWYLDAGGGLRDTVLQWVEYAAILVEGFAVLIIVVASIAALSRYLWRYATHTTQADPFHELKVSPGRACYLGWRCLLPQM
jgi:hypothetical protein